VTYLEKKRYVDFNTYDERKRSIVKEVLEGAFKVQKKKKNYQNDDMWELTFYVVFPENNVLWELILL